MAPTTHVPPTTHLVPLVVLVLATLWIVSALVAPDLVPLSEELLDRVGVEALNVPST